MRTRNAGKPKPEAPPPKKTPPSRRSAAKFTPPEDDVTTSDLVEQANLSADAVDVTPETKVTRGKGRSSTRKTPVKTKPPTSAKTGSRRTRKSEVTEELKVEESLQKDEGEDHDDEESVQKKETSKNAVEESRKKAEAEKEVGDHREGESSKNEEASEAIVEDTMTNAESATENIEVTEKEGVQFVMNVGESSKNEEASEAIVEDTMTNAESATENIEVTEKKGVQFVMNVGESSKNEEASEAIAEDTMTNAKSATENIEVTEKEGVQFVMNVGEFSKNEEASEAIVEDTMTNAESATENIEVDEEEGVQFVMNVREPPKVEEKISVVEQPLVPDIVISSEQVEYPVGTEEDEELDDPEEDDETIGPQQGGKTTDTEQTLDQSIMNTEEPLKTEVETIDTAQHSGPLDQNVMDVEECLKIEEKPVEEEETVDQIVTDLTEFSKTDIDTIENEQSLVSNDGEATSQKEESQELAIGMEAAKKELDEDTNILEDKLGMDNEPANMEEDVANHEESSKTDEDAIDTKKSLDHSVMDVEEPLKMEEKTLEKEDSDENEHHPVSIDGETTSHKEARQELGRGKEEEKKSDEEMKTLEDKMGTDDELANMEEDVMYEDVNQTAKEKDPKVGDESPNKEKLDESEEKDAVEDLKEGDALEVERAELNAAAKESKLRKELEIFVGGLDRDATEEDLKKAFENIGEIVKVRLLKDTSSNKSKGCAFVKFATKELASQALLEMKTPLIRGKRCRTAPSEDNDMLFLGNICNTWTKEAIKQKLKDYGIESVENINVIPDARHEGLSRGFAFLEFSCHADAMQAYKRLQKPDAIFGHSERTAKVAFAEPVREPDPEVMAQVKSVFVDGLPPQWNEEKVREKLKGCGEIVRITLARNMSTAKRRDFGFVDFNTHQDAVACIESINSKDFGEGNSKGKVRARLSNPLPKTQVVKGGMCGGFRIGHGGGATSSSRSGRGPGFGEHEFNRPNFQRNRGAYQRVRGQTGRVGLTRERDAQMQYPPPFQRRDMFGRGGWRDHAGPAHGNFPAGSTPLRPHPDMIRHDAAGNRGYERHTPNSRLPFRPEEAYNRPVMGRQMDDPYFYDGGSHGIKRPYSMTDQELDYMDRSRLRPRIDYSVPVVPYQAPSYRDSFEPDRNLQSHDHYGPDYRGGPRPAFNGNGRPYGGGYPPRY